MDAHIYTLETEAPPTEATPVASELHEVAERELEAA